MPNPYFCFKQFKINQGLTAMKVGTDGVLLGAWCEVSASRKVLDIGTGTGLLALMVAQRQPEAQIHAIDIESTLDATQNFEESPWSDRLSVEQISLQDFVSRQSLDCPLYDHIISNPPYFQDSLKGPSSIRNRARHTDSLSFQQLACSCNTLLSADGHVSVIIPYSSSEALIREFTNHGFNVSRQTDVYPQQSSITPKRALLEFVRGACATESDSLAIETDQRHCYTSRYKALTQAFYLDK